MLVTTKVALDLQKAGYPARVEAVQDDQNTRCLEVSLCSGGVPWPVPEGVAVSMRYRKPDMTRGYYDTMPDGSAAWSTQENVISMLLAPQMLTAAGTVVAQLELVQDNQILGTFPVLVAVEENPASGVVASEDYVNWLKWMQTELDNHLVLAMESGEFDGPAGPAGAAAVLLDSEVSYQASGSGTEIPTGEWSGEIPAVEPGSFLWTRTVYTFNTGEPVEQYSVSRFAKDGSGVEKVCSVLAADGWSEAAPYTQTITVEGLSDDRNARAYPAVSTGTLEEKLALSEEIGKVRWCTREGSAVTFECLEEKPGMDIPVIVEVHV